MTNSRAKGRDIAPGVPAQKGSVMEDIEDGRVASDRALVSDQAAPRLAPSGFDPSRYEGKPRKLPKSEKRLLRALIDAVEERMALMTDREQTDLLCACLNVSPINCAWDEYHMAGLIYSSLSHDVANRDSDGSGEADKTGTGLAEGDSAGRNGIAKGASA